MGAMEKVRSRVSIEVSVLGVVFTELFILICTVLILRLLGSVDLCWLNFVRVKNVLIEANGL